MMKLFHLIQFLVLVFLLSACTAGQVSQTNRTEPGWVTGDDTRYSSQTYITGQGNYKYLNKAKINAREDIARQFKIVLNSEIFPFLTAPRTYVTSNDALLSGIQIIDAWQNPATLNHHVFATLSRKRANTIIKNKISKLDDSTRTAIDNATIEKDKLQKLIYASQALDTQLERFAYQQTLNNILPAGKSPATPVWQIPKLNDDLKKLLHRIRIKPRVINDDTQKIKKALIEGLKLSGLTIDSTKSADFVLQARLILDYTNQQVDNRYDTKGELKITLTDQNRKIRVKHGWPINISVEQADMTNKVIAEQALNIFATQLQTALIQYSTKEK